MLLVFLLVCFSATVRFFSLPIRLCFKQTVVCCFKGFGEIISKKLFLSKIGCRFQILES